MKDYDINAVKSEILGGLSQVDSSFLIDEFNCNYDPSTRKLSVSFTAHNADGETVEVSDLWQD